MTRVPCIYLKVDDWVILRLTQIWKFLGLCPGSVWGLAATPKPAAVLYLAFLGPTFGPPQSFLHRYAPANSWQSFFLDILLIVDVTYTEMRWMDFNLWWKGNVIHVFFYKQRFFSTPPQCCLTFPWIQLRMLLSCCLVHVSIIILRQFLYLLYLCLFLDLGLFMSFLCNLFFISIFIFIMINCIISWIQTIFDCLLYCRNL